MGADPERVIGQEEVRGGMQQNGALSLPAKRANFRAWRYPNSQQNRFLDIKADIDSPGSYPLSPFSRTPSGPGLYQRDPCFDSARIC